MHKIAVIDSGIGQIEEGFLPYVIDQYHISIGSEDFDIETPVAPHAKVILKILVDELEQVQIYDIRILDNHLEGNLSALKMALQLALTLDNDAVNLSLGFKNPFYGILLYPYIRKLNKKGILVVAAQDNVSGKSYPAAFRNVIGVCEDSKLKKDEIQLIRGGYSANGVVEYSNGSEILTINGSSFAAARVLAYKLKEKMAYRV
jgi:hypothetical protein